ncbi:hypothetical protein Ancab_021764, partial [Ancistrocladus abbreviatus]
GYWVMAKTPASGQRIGQVIMYYPENFNGCIISLEKWCWVFNWHRELLQREEEW